MKNTKNNHRKQISLCQTLAKLLATGLACAAVLIGSPIPPAGGIISHENTGSAGAWDCEGNGTDNGPGISPQNNWDTLLDKVE